jgi:SAM-dependent methyltransferase
MASRFYDLPAFLAGKSSLTEIESLLLGRVEDQDLLHLQCHFGMDSLSLARAGARVTGIDFSGEAITAALMLSERIQVPARFVQADIYGLEGMLQERFDIVYATYGTVVWLPDLTLWARVVDLHLLPGGRLYFSEFHPALYMFDFEDFERKYHYFGKPDPYSEVVKGSYADPGSEIMAKEHFWNHSVGEILQPFLEMGYVLEIFREFPFSPYPCFPNMTETEPGRFVWRRESSPDIPHILTMVLRKPNRRHAVIS